MMTMQNLGAMKIVGEKTVDFSFSQDKIVEILVPDPKHIPDLAVKLGYLGESDLDGYCRLYLTPELNEYIEILKDDVQYSQKINSESASLGTTILWINQNAKLKHTKTISKQQAQQEFLQGPITANFLPGTGFNYLTPMNTVMTTVPCTITITITLSLCPTPLTRPNAC